MRTDGPYTVTSRQAGFGHYRVTHIFSTTVAHEARHVWQRALVIQTGPSFHDEEVEKTLPNRNPDNNDDFVYYDETGSVIADADSVPVFDCLPGIARLISNPLKIVSGPAGSARALIDSDENPEGDLGHLLHGELPGGQGEAFLADRCRLNGDVASKLKERDAIRFTRALDGHWR